MITTNKVAIYVRVSTTNQAEEGYSIDEQKDKLISYCKIKDWTVYDVYVDGGFSGSNTERPALEQLIKDAKSKSFDTVLVYKLDRLSRSQKDTLYLIEDIFIKNDIAFLSLQENFDTSTPFGKAMIGLLSVFAQLEREQIKERMQLGKLGRAKAGKSMMWSKVAYGYNYHVGTGEMTINELEARAVKYAFETYLAGRSITKLRDDMNQKYPKKTPWSYRTIRQMLANPVYCGYNQYKGQVFLGNHAPIVSEETYNKTQEELKIRQRKAADLFNPRPFQARYLLSGLLKCGYCGAPLKIIMGRPRKDGTRYFKYECQQRHPKKALKYNDNKICDSETYDKQDLEQYVLKEISEFQDNKDTIDNLFFNTNTRKLDRENLERQLKTLSNKLEKINNLYINDMITLDELKAKSADIKITKNQIQFELENDPAKKQEERKKDIIKLLSCENILEMDYEEQKVLVRSLVHKVIVKAHKIFIQWKV